MQERKKEVRKEGRKEERIWISGIEGTLKIARTVGRNKNPNRREIEDRVLSRHRNTEKKKRRIQRRKKERNIGIEIMKKDKIKERKMVRNNIES